ncbi:MAG: hypothetical protein FJ119_00155 [Deltaproteobacteria bacterium]|nr:hypothetical protein [Deltaproteobacteria bacterium]
MPREVTHRLIARQTAAALRGALPGEPLEALPNCLLPGAALHGRGHDLHPQASPTCASGA